MDVSRAAVAAMSLAPNVFAQAAAAPPASAATQPTTDAQNTNIQAYVELLRSNVQTAKTEVLTETMQLNDAQSTKFWPIYREYNVKLQALNDKKLAGIKLYAKEYDTITDAQADQLAKLVLDLENERNALKKDTTRSFAPRLGGLLPRAGCRWKTNC